MKKKLKIAWNAAWAVAVVAAGAWVYADRKADGHDSLVFGAHYYYHHPLDVFLLTIGGLGFWLGMRALTGRR